MEVVINFLYAFLILIGAISIISSLVSLSSNISESNSSIETKWFKWTAPVRLVFGLLCILSVIVINKYDFYSIDKTKLLELEANNKSLILENKHLKKKSNLTDTTENPYFLLIENHSGTPFLEGNVIVSNEDSKLTIRGAETFSENYEKVLMKNYGVRTGDKYFIKVEGTFWGMNVLAAGYYNDYIVQIQMYKVDKIMQTNKEN